MSSIDKIVQGVLCFQENAFQEKAELFKELAKGQSPKILFITCSDSRVDPGLITRTDPGDMFVVKNAGNIIPPYGAMQGGTLAAIEYAVSILNVEHVIVCGHSHCGAMEALLDEEKVKELPQTIREWLSYAEATKFVVDQSQDPISREDRIEAYVHQNIPVQLNHLTTIPAVAAKLAQNQLEIHGWVFHISTGDVAVYDSDTESFRDFKEHYSK